MAENFDNWRQSRECERHKPYSDLKTAAKKRSKMHSLHGRSLYIWECPSCGLFHISKMKEGTKLHKTAIKVNKKGEIYR